MDTDDYSVERWKPISGWEDSYEISSHGRLKGIALSGRRRVTRIRRLKKSKCGYLVSCLFDHGRRKDVRIHVLVAEAFICPRPHGLIVNHKDGCKTNNHVLNLEWVSYKQNVAHAYSIGLCREGSNHPRRLHPEKWANVGAANFGDRAGDHNGFSILTSTLVGQIKLRLLRGDRLTDIARDYGVHKSTISNIKHGRTWTHTEAAGSLGPPNGLSIL